MTESTRILAFHSQHDQTGDMKKALMFLVSAGLSGALLYFLFQKIDSEAVFAQIKEFARGWGLITLVIWSLMYVSIQGLRFFFLYPAHSSYRIHWGLNICNHTANILLPGRIGEATRPTYLKRWHPELPLKEIAYWSVFEKLPELCSMLIFIGIGVFLFYGPMPLDPKNTTAYGSANLIVIVSILALVIALMRRKGYSVHGYGRNSDKSMEAHQDPKGPFNQKQKFFFAVLLSVCTWAANTAGIIAITGDVKVAFALLVSMTLAGAIPMLPAGLGAAQWAAVALADLLEIAQTEALAYSAAIHVIWILTRIAFGIPLIFFVWGWPQQKSIATEASSN